jgi:hypothetical protein
MTSVLSAEQIGEFVESGCCVVRGAYSRHAAASLADAVWERVEAQTAIRRSDRQTWPTHYYLPPVAADQEAFACMTPHLERAIEELVGPFDRGTMRWNFPMNFTIRDRTPGQAPFGGWHIDGVWEHDSLQRLPFSLLVIGLVTDIEPGFGGTVLSLGSHKRSARVIADPETNLFRPDLFRELLSDPIGNFYEINGRAGDVVLIHPFVLHTTGYNCFGPPRIINSIRVKAVSPLCLDGPDEERTPLERSIRTALHETPIVPDAARLCQPMLD